MKVTTNPILQAPRTLSTPKGPQDEMPGGPGPDKSGGFGDRFMSSLDRTSEKAGEVLTPLALMFAGSFVGRMVGGIGLGTVGGLISPSAAMPAAQVGGLVGSLAGGYAGVRYGRNIQEKPGNLIDSMTGNSRVGRTLLSTAFASALGGAMTGFALGFTPTTMAIGAGLTLAGIGGYSAYQARN